MRSPNELRDNSRGSAWLNKSLRYNRSNALSSSPEIRVNKGSHGTTLELTRRAGSGGVVGQYVLKEVLANYYRCRKWDGTTAGDTDFYIARPFGHRRGNFDPTQGGPAAGVDFSSDGDSFTATYSYESATKRTKTISGNAEVQVIIPYFKVDFDLIYATAVASAITYGTAKTPLTDPAGNPIRLLDLNVEGRAWAKLETTQGN